MLGMNSKQTAMFLGTVLVLVGLVGLLGADESPVLRPPLTKDGQPTLEVKRGSSSPASTINYLQGSGGLQRQGQQLQDLNASNRLQPNAGVDNLPENY